MEDDSGRRLNHCGEVIIWMVTWNGNSGWSHGMVIPDGSRFQFEIGNFQTRVRDRSCLCDDSAVCDW